MTFRELLRGRGTLYPFYTPEDKSCQGNIFMCMALRYTLIDEWQRLLDEGVATCISGRSLAGRRASSEPTWPF